MGYITKNIAEITEPALVTLAALPNFVQFASLPHTPRPLELEIRVNLIPEPGIDIESVTRLTVVSPDGAIRAFHGTTDPARLAAGVFLVSEIPSETAENLRQLFLSDAFLSAFFDIRIPFTWIGGNPFNGNTLHIRSRGAGRPYNMLLSAPGNVGDAAYTLNWINATSVNGDSISGEEGTADIFLEVYADPAVALGGDDLPDTPEKVGRQIATLSKTYSGQPLWFDLNGLFSQFTPHNLPTDGVGWFDPGTARAYRFLAKTRGANVSQFYASNALFVLSGYGRLSDGGDLTPYVYDGTGEVRLLTNRPRTGYIRGQREYLNFLYRIPSAPSPLRIAYRAYNTAGQYLGTVYGQETADFGTANACLLDIDAVLDRHPFAGIVRVALARGKSIVSNDIEYQILPECYHTLLQFSFVNRLGGWDAFNFDAEAVDAVRPSREVFHQTVTPAFRRGDSVEAVYGATLGDTITVTSAPLTDEVADWLKELAAARVVLDRQGRYAIIEEFTLQLSQTDRNRQRATMRYRLSETYTND